MQFSMYNNSSAQLNFPWHKIQIQAIDWKVAAFVNLWTPEVETWHAATVYLYPVGLFTYEHANIFNTTSNTGPSKHDRIPVYGCSFLINYCTTISTAMVV